jgi:anti-sigma factor RsiW
VIGEALVTCRQLADFILEYLDGQLPDQTKSAFEHHLTLCPNCVNYIASYGKTVEMARRAFDADPSEPSLQMPEELVRAILAARQAPGETP